MDDITFHLGYKVAMTFKPVEPGTFVMGDEDLSADSDGWGWQVKHTVAITRKYWLGQTLVTRAQWQQIMGYKPSEYTGGPDYPVDSVSWQDAMAFCRKMTERFGKELPGGYEFFLPTEAQWEYACRTDSADALDDVAWYGKCLKTRPVAQKKPNELGLYDMLGNLMEWCYDWGDSLPANDDALEQWCNGVNLPKCSVDPIGLGVEYLFSGHIVRGGYYHSSAEQCTPFRRKNLNPEANLKHIGFRVAIRPKTGYTYFDPCGELADKGLALEEGETDSGGLVYRNADHERMHFFVMPDHHIDDPNRRCFQIYDDHSRIASTKKIRIRFTAPEYLFYRNTDEKPDWILAPEEKSRLMELLTADNGRLWKELIHQYNWEAFGANNYEQASGEGIPEDLPIPDYTMLPDCENALG